MIHYEFTPLANGHTALTITATDEPGIEPKADIRLTIDVNRLIRAMGNNAARAKSRTATAVYYAVMARAENVTRTPPEAQP